MLGIGFLTACDQRVDGVAEELWKQEFDDDVEREQANRSCHLTGLASPETHDRPKRPGRAYGRRRRILVVSRPRDVTEPVRWNPGPGPGPDRENGLAGWVPQETLFLISWRRRVPFRYLDHIAVA